MIDIEPLAEALKRFWDVHVLFEYYSIACNRWSNNEMDFGLADRHIDSIRREMLEQI